MSAMTQWKINTTLYWIQSVTDITRQRIIIKAEDKMFTCWPYKLQCWKMSLALENSL